MIVSEVVVLLLVMSTVVILVGVPFFFQAEDGIRDFHVTGVQTCDLPIYTKLYGHVAGGQAEYLRVPQAQFGPVKVPHGPPDERFLYLSDVLPTGWQAAKFADIPKGGSVAVFGLGPVGQFAARCAALLGAEQVFGVDIVPERLDLARRHGIHAVHAGQLDDVPAHLADLTE